MSTLSNTVVQVQVLRLGNPVHTIHVPMKEWSTFKHFLIENYASIFQKEPLTEPDELFAWRSFTRQNVDRFKYAFNYYYLTCKGISDAPLHLIDKLDTSEIRIFNSGIYTNDAIWFFLQEQLKDQVEVIAQTCQDNFALEVLGALERLLTTADAQILLDNFSGFEAHSSTEHFVKHIIPFNTWQKLNTKKLSYYKKFIVSFTHSLLLLDHCLARHDTFPTPIAQSNKEEWLHCLLFRMQNQMLTLLSIPEAFVRLTHPTVHNFSDGLQMCGVQKLTQKDKYYYQAHIANRAITDIYQALFNKMAIYDYYDYIEYCVNTLCSDSYVSEICHTFRILFNNLKHAAHVEVIQSRDVEAIKKAEMDEINTELDRLQNSDLNSSEREDKIRNLLIRKEFIDKVRHMHETIDFQDPDFIKNNGIQIHSTTGDFFKISIADLELSLKILIGILVILEKSIAKPGVV